jgi:VWFA-related protein
MKRFAGIILLCSSVARAQSGDIRFKAETNLVLVPVVVRNATGNAVGNLRQEDFQVFDNGKPQVIAKFALEDTSGQVAEDRSLSAGGTATKAAPMAIPSHFVALLFDDLHMIDLSDLAYVRNAAVRLLDTLQPADRVAIVTASGQVALDFTADRAKLRDTLAQLRYGPMTQDMVAGRGRDSQAVLMQSETIVRRMAHLPGQRTAVLISPGLSMDGIVPDTMRLIDEAVQSRVVFNSLDARGLALRRAGEMQEFQARLTDGTGGRFITDTNDLNGAIRRLAATPKYIYVLGFSPQALEPDGKFHTLTVKLDDGKKLDLQARKGYWAPGESHPIEVAEATVVTTPVPPPAAATKAAPPANDEVTTRDDPVTFRVESNLVEVPVVVRDRQGHAVGNLNKDDFRVFDKGKRQEITKFTVQQSSAPGIQAKSRPAPGGSSDATVPQAPPPMPNRFIAFVFDDVHVRFEDLPQVRAAVVKYVGTSLGPGDRVALFTTSGRIGVDFTDRPAEFNEALLKISPNPIHISALGSCLYVSYFQAVQIDQQVGLQPQPSDMSRSSALKIAVFEAGQCNIPDAFHVALQEVRDAYTSGRQETRATLEALKRVVQRMSAMAGQRSVVLISPGFFVPPDLQHESSDVIGLAVRSKVVIGTIDARGVWINPMFDASRNVAPPATLLAEETTFKQLDAEAATDQLIALAEGTGGTLNRNNDFAGGVRNAAGAPEYLYVLGFSPQNLKPDGSFHALKVTMNSGERYSLQVRRGYWAPNHAEDPESVSKQEIETAVFSREEVHNLPVEMHTRVTKAGEQAKLNVLTSVDLKLIHLRKADDRNRNDLTIVAAVFDSNGNFIAGTQKTLQLRLRDETVAGLEQKPPVTIATDFDMKPGAYLVRLVVRDAEAQQLTAENAGVQIP